MKTISKITELFMVALFLCAFVPTFMFAQAVQSQSKLFVESHLNKIKQEITLTDDQEQGIRKILETFYVKRDHAQKQNSLNKEAILEKKSAQLYYLHQLDSILSEDQKHTLSEKVKLRTLNAEDKQNLKIQ
jgi:lipopolysaccharide export LptBFGC system permease protein LptF